VSRFFFSTPFFGGREEKIITNPNIYRGWTSTRDILGYYNPISASFQSARSGLYDFIKRVCDPEKKNALSVVLLDEANLSQIEHYWADFLVMCDKGTNREIYTGAFQEALTIHDNFRFIATINNDNTTERLSPRLIDRSPIIFIEPIFELKDIKEPELPEESLPLDYQDFKKLMKTSVDYQEFDSREESVLNSIIDKLKDNDENLKDAPKIFVSPRKILAIKEYCSIARNLINRGGGAIDFAVAQHILPLIEGYGEAYGCRLKVLNEELGETGLLKSQRILEQIIKSGKASHHSYSFF
jgi:hypothetical protein